ncbi:54S ribosomal protein L4 mitochondrial [Tulasnella sp. 424]|nr:54S ribosomal protein L4 mitochondrial [Tulasnella sp. 424]KAG8968494.1 54S ribosomal protein L4 mitochondrial [Tulasnella sp. 425]
MSLLAQRLTRQVVLASPSSSRRLLATAVDAKALAEAVSDPPQLSKAELDATRRRPPSNVKISEDHGLWAFFRKDKEGKVLTLEPAHKTEDFSGRSWHAVELRRKSFKDLHTLWYVCLRERNLLATQRAEFRRLNIGLEGTTNLMDKDKRVRKTMKLIKLVLNERRLAYEQAKELWEQGQQTAQSEPDAEPVKEETSEAAPSVSA